MVLLVLAAKRIDDNTRMTHHTTMNERTWGQTLRHAMDAQGDSCRSLGVELGVSGTAVLNWCADRSVPSQARADDVAAKYGIALPEQRRNGRPPGRA